MHHKSLRMALQKIPLGICIAIVTCTGCGGGLNAPATVPVTGVVKYKGKPARGIRVIFNSQSGTNSTGFIPTGETGPDGSFALSTGAPLNGAPPGEYVVTFQRPTIDPRNPIETEIDTFQGKYDDPSQSKWKVTVIEGDNNFPPFELE